MAACAAASTAATKSPIRSNSSDTAAQFGAIAILQSRRESCRKPGTWSIHLGCECGQLVGGAAIAEADRCLQCQDLIRELSRVGGEIGGLARMDECLAQRSLGRGNPSPCQHQFRF